MKETVNVSISGISFILDRECYAMLSNYLNQTEVSLRSNPSSAEILADVEARIAEQILSVQSAEVPVPMHVLRPIIEQLGGTVNTSEDNNEQATTTQPNAKPLTKRLYRNPEGSMLGGVCSGLATYFNTHTAIFRILFILPFIFKLSSLFWWPFNFGWHFSSLQGTAFSIYMILWIVIPRARTPRQKLEMQGDNITVNSIAKGQTTMPAKKESSDLGNLILTLLKVFAITFGSLLFLSVLLGVVVGFAKLSIEMHREWTPIQEALNIMGISYFWASLCASGIVLIPFISIMYNIFAGSFGFRFNKIVNSILAILWIGLVIFMFVLIMSNIGELANIRWEHWNTNWDYWSIRFD